MENKKIKIGIIIFLIIFIMGIIIGYLYYKNHFNKRPDFEKGQGFDLQQNGSKKDIPPQNFQLDESQISELKSFFNSTTNLDDIKNYCLTNPFNCMYYCKEINSSNEICSQIQMPTYRGKP
jgi:hypothetical protein